MKTTNSKLNNRNALTSGQPKRQGSQTPNVPCGTVDTETRAIFFDGPFSQPDPKGEKDESPYWTVYLGRDWADPIRTVYHVNSFKRAESLAQAMAHDRKLELVQEAMPA